MSLYSHWIRRYGMYGRTGLPETRERTYKANTIIECESSEEIVNVAKELVTIYEVKDTDYIPDYSPANKGTVYSVKLIKKFTNLACQDQNIASCKSKWIPIVIFGCIVLKELSFILLIIINFIKV